MAFTLINPLYPRPHYAAGAGSTIASGFMLSITTGSVTSFTASNFDSNCELVFLDFQGGSVTTTFDGTNPAAGSRGHILAAGTNYTWQLATVLSAKFIGTTSAASSFASQFAP